MKETGDPLSENAEHNHERDECKKEQDNAFETLNKDQAEYDKQLLALSAAFLGVSLAFVKDVVPLRDVVRLWEFDLALSCLLACIGMVLWTFQYSIHVNFGLVKYWKLIGERLQAPDNEKAEINKQIGESWSKVSRGANRVRVANITSGVLFAVGTLFLVIFVLTNVRRESRIAAQQDGIVGCKLSISSETNGDQHGRR